MQECALYGLILAAAGLPCPSQRSAQFRATLSASSGFCKGRLYLYSINCSYSFGGDNGRECHYSFPFLSTTESIHVSLCLCFPSSLLLSLHYSDTSWDMVIFFFSLFGFCGVGFFESVCVFFACFYYFCHLIF